jgi:Type II secretory pathway, ATPase PulE/Tfp pilus assembly pathway, ATPase PilB
MSALENFQLVKTDYSSSQNIVELNITAPDENSKWYIPEDDDLRGMCLFDEKNELLYVCDGKQNHIEVASFMDKLERFEMNFGIIVTNYEAISAAYSSHYTNNEDQTENQSIVMKIIRDAINKKASDIHLIDRGGKSVIKFRINGNLLTQPLDRKSDRVSQLMPTIYPSMLDVSDTHYKSGEKQDGRIKKDLLLELGLIGGRVSTTPTDVGSMMVIRLLKDNSKTDLSLEKLGYADYHLTMLRKIQKKTAWNNYFKW